MSRLDRARLLEQLPRLERETQERSGDDLRRISLASALLALAKIDHDNEHQLCRSVAATLLGKVPEPDPFDPEE